MLNFVFILSIIFEISITAFLVLKLIETQKCVENWNKNLDFGANIFFKINSDVNSSIKKINRVVSIFTNKKLIAIARILKSAVNIAQIIILIRSFKLSKGFLVNFNTFKKLMYTQIVKGIIKYFCKYL